MKKKKPTYETLERKVRMLKSICAEWSEMRDELAQRNRGYENHLEEYKKNLELKNRIIHTQSEELVKVQREKEEIVETARRNNLVCADLRMALRDEQDRKSKLLDEYQQHAQKKTAENEVLAEELRQIRRLCGRLSNDVETHAQGDKRRELLKAVASLRIVCGV